MAHCVVDYVKVVSEVGVMGLERVAGVEEAAHRNEVH